MAPTKKRSPVYKYFVYDLGNDEHKCVMEYAGSVVMNLRGHLERYHKDDLHQEFLQLQQKECPPGAFLWCDFFGFLPNFLFYLLNTELFCTAKKAKLDAQNGAAQKILPFVSEKKRVTVEVDEQFIHDAFVELVTKNGRPFPAVEDSGLRKFVDPYLRALHMTMNRNKAAELVKIRAEKEMENLRHSLWGTFVSVKTDIASRLSRGFLGLNIQFSVTGKLKVVTLVVKELHGSHDG